MSNNSNIEWTESTWNMLGGCSKCSPGCDNCYAERMTHRLGRNLATPQYAGLTDAQGHWTGEVRPFDAKIEEPKRWYKPRRVFVQSMGDLFHPGVPDWLHLAVFSVIERCPQHTFMMLTKRPDVMANAVDCAGRHAHWPWPKPNLWLGVTVCNQAEADAKIPLLLQIPAAVRFVSIEPMLEEIDFSKFSWRQMSMDELPGSALNDGCSSGIMIYINKPDWVICGAETGPQKRRMEIQWARDIRDQCNTAGVPFFFKKDSTGSRCLDGRIWDAYPNTKGG